MQDPLLHKGRVTKLDGLRGIFSLMVLFFHYPAAYIPGWFYQFFLIRESSTFVDFFFVLSGFVIAYNYHHLNVPGALRNYLTRRFIRIYPLLLYCATFVLLYSIGYAYAKHLLVQAHPGLFNSKDVIFQGDLFHQFLDTILLTNSTPILGKEMGLPGPAWSISAECISYLVYGFLFLMRSTRLRIVIAGSLIILCMFLLFQTGEYFSTGAYGFLRGLLTFSCGYLIWESRNLLKHIPDYTEYLLPLLILTCLFFLHRTDDTTGPGLLFGMCTVPLLFSATIFILLRTHGMVSAFLETRPMQFLGKISYSLYLNHWYIIAFLTPVFIHFGRAENNALLQVFIFLLITAVCIWYSSLTYTYIENRFGKWLKRRLLVRGSEKHKQ